MTAEKHKGRLQSKGQKSGVNKAGVHTSGEKKNNKKFRDCSSVQRNQKSEHSDKHFYSILFALLCRIWCFGNRLKSRNQEQSARAEIREQGPGTRKVENKRISRICFLKQIIKIINGSLYTRAYIS